MDLPTPIHIQQPPQMPCLLQHIFIPICPFGQHLVAFMTSTAFYNSMASPHKLPSNPLPLLITKADLMEEEIPNMAVKMIHVNNQTMVDIMVQVLVTVVITISVLTVTAVVTADHSLPNLPQQVHRARATKHTEAAAPVLREQQWRHIYSQQQLSPQPQLPLPRLPPCHYKLHHQQCPPYLLLTITTLLSVILH